MSAATDMRLDPRHGGVERAAHYLAEGRLVGIPTETVYGLGGDAANPAAIAAIYAAKGRPANHPVIVHLPPGGDPLRWAARLPDAARRLIDAFWPGPLTLILPRAAHVDAMVSGGQDSVGLRCPSHPLAQALLKAFSAQVGGQGGVAAPSANRFGRVSPTTAQHVLDEFKATIPVLDGGPCEVGIESTIVDLSRGFPALLRPGHIGPARLAEVLGEMPRLPGADAPRASGTLSAHYAPDTPVRLLPAAQLLGELAQAPAGPLAAVLRETTREQLAPRADLTVIAAPTEAEAYAQALYAMLRRLDAGGFTRIYVELLPDTPEWQAVNDRLGRAAAAFRSAS